MNMSKHSELTVSFETTPQWVLPSNGREKSYSKLTKPVTRISEQSSKPGSTLCAVENEPRADFEVSLSRQDLFTFFANKSARDLNFDLDQESFVHASGMHRKFLEHNISYPCKMPRTNSYLAIIIFDSINSLQMTFKVAHCLSKVSH